MKTNSPFVITAAMLVTAAHLHADHVILDDCIIDGSLAVGLDAVNGENFGFDTIRIKENNLRFHFDDTSVAASFPRNDWRFIANDSANGGDSYLAIEDVTGGRIPFRVRAGAGNHSLYIDPQGDVGLGTNNPILELHITDGDTPSVRLEQDGSNGWNPQTWDVAGNETNFFIRDVTNGSKLPFRIRPDAPSNSLEIEASGAISLPHSVVLGPTNLAGGNRLHVTNLAADNADDVVINDTGQVAIGTVMPAANSLLHIANASPANVDDVVVNDMGQLGVGTIAPTGARVHLFHDDTEILRLERDAMGNEANFMTFYDGDGRTGFFGHASDTTDDMWMANEAGGDIVLSVGGGQDFEMDSGGNVTTAGTVNGASDRNVKKDIVPVDAQQLLEKVIGLPISEWTYKGDGNIRHIGPMAQDFRKSFGLGKNDKTISFHDPAGVALAAIQGLNQKVEEKDQRIADLEKQNAELEARLKRIEQALLGAE